MRKSLADMNGDELRAELAEHRRNEVPTDECHGGKLTIVVDGNHLGHACWYLTPSEIVEAVEHVVYDISGVGRDFRPTVVTATYDPARS